MTGKLLRNQDNKERWNEHFVEVLNMDQPAEAVEQIQSEELYINTEPQSIREIVRSIKKLKNDKTPGSDIVQVGGLKADIEVIPTACTTIFKRIWMDKEIPSDWKKRNQNRNYRTKERKLRIVR